MDNSFFKKIREFKLFDKITQKQVDSMTILLTEAEKAFKDKRHVAYLLATTYHETGRTMLPIEERGSDAYLKSKPYYPYIGRGYVQITWDTNYKKFSKILGVDIYNNPLLALDPDLAAKIACKGMKDGLFTGKKLSDYFNDSKTDPINARKIINGLDRAEQIAGFYKKFVECI